MVRPIRNTDPGKFHTISAKTFQDQFLIAPSEKVNNIIAGVVARYQEKYEIEIYAYNFLSNHYHIVARAPKKNLWKFAQNINREISKRINWLRDRRGALWHKRYVDLIIPEEQDILNAVLYASTNPCHHGLVQHPRHWPGINCYSQLIDEKPRKAKFTNYTDYGKAKKKNPNARLSDFKSTHYITITPLPQFAKLTKAERANKLNSLIEEKTESIKKQRLNAGKGFLGRKQVLRQNPKSFPKKVTRSPEPICYSKNPEAIKAFREWFIPWVEEYREISKKFRAGFYNVKFPAHSIKPPSHYEFAFSPT